MRTPTAGGFYPTNKTELEEMLGRMLSSCANSCSIAKIRGAVVPHAGYYYSGRMAAKVYSLLKLKPGSTVVILGTNHTGLGEKAAVSLDSWKTPLGVVETDAELAEKIVKGGKGILKFDEIAHSEEHSIEVQLPFLQFLFKDFMIVAISVSSDMYYLDYKDIAAAIYNATKNTDTVIIASSDFTHCGARYGLIPPAKNVPEWVKKTDSRLIDAALHFDAEKFLELGRETTACGTGPVATLVSAMKKRVRKAELIEYTTSFDISGNDHAVVGYAGLVFGE